MSIVKLFRLRKELARSSRHRVITTGWVRRMWAQSQEGACPGLCSCGALCHGHVCRRGPAAIPSI